MLPSPASQCQASVKQPKQITVVANERSSPSSQPVQQQPSMVQSTSFLPSSKLEKTESEPQQDLSNNKKSREIHAQSQPKRKNHFVRRKIFICPISPEEVFPGPTATRNTLLSALLLHHRISYQISKWVQHHYLVSSFIRLCYAITMANVIAFQSTGRLPSDWIEPSGRADRTESPLSIGLYTLFFVVPFASFLAGHLSLLRTVLVRRVFYEPYVWVAIFEISALSISYSGTFCWSRGGLSSALSLWTIGIFACFYDALSPAMRKRERWIYVGYSAVLLFVCLSLFLRHTPGMCFAPLETLATTSAEELSSTSTEEPAENMCAAGASSGDGSWFTSNDVFSRLASQFGLELIDIALGRAASMVFLLTKLLLTAFGGDIRQCTLIVYPVKLSVTPIDIVDGAVCDSPPKNGKTSVDLCSRPEDTGKGSRVVISNVAKDEDFSSTSVLKSEYGSDGSTTRGRPPDKNQDIVSARTLSIASESREKKAEEGQQRVVKYKEVCRRDSAGRISSSSVLPLAPGQGNSEYPRMKLVAVWKKEEILNGYEGKCLAAVFGIPFARKYLATRRRFNTIVLIYSVVSTAFYGILVLPFLLSSYENRRIMCGFAMALTVSLFENFLSAYNFELVRRVMQRVDFWFALVKCIQFMTAFAGVFCLKATYSIFFFGLGCGTIIGCFFMDALPLKIQRSFRFYNFLVMIIIVVGVRIVLSNSIAELNCLNVRFSPFGGPHKTLQQECEAIRTVRLGYYNTTVTDLILSRTFSWREMLVSGGVSIFVLYTLQMMTGLLDNTRLAMIESPMLLIEENEGNASE